MDLTASQDDVDSLMETNISIDIPLKIHDELDKVLSNYSMVPFDSGAPGILTLVLSGCEPAFSETNWPIDHSITNIAACENILESNPEINGLLKEAHQSGRYSKIRRRVEFHKFSPTEAMQKQPQNLQVPPTQSGGGKYSTPFSDSVAPFPASKRRRVTPQEPDTVIAARVETFKALLRDTFAIYLTDNVQLPLWQPSQGPDEERKHIASLAIPLSSRFSQSPSLLLHDLGHIPDDGHIAKLVRKLFHEGSPQKFLCNTSGSGKTSVIFEGLCRNWGFYLTARTLPDHVGSSDLETILEILKTEGRLAELPADDFESLLADNRELAVRYFLRVIYVRMVIFRVFLDCASLMTGGITEGHKARWLLAQISPHTLFGEDVFLSLTNQLSSASTTYLRRSFAEELTGVRILLGRQRPVLHTVLDEGQAVMNEIPTHFLSNGDPPYPQPVLRPIILAWTTLLPNLIVAGTGISKQDAEDILGSAVAKEDGDPPPETVTELGAFDHGHEQRKYLEKYLPTGFLNTDSGRALASRLEYWLHGRHRFTASYISCLMKAGFLSPHRVLNEFVYRMTGFKPSDGDEFTKDEPPMTIGLEGIHGFDFSKLLKRPDLLRQVAGFIFDYIFMGKLRDLGGPDTDKLVEYGVARFGNAKDIIVDEPLAILAATRCFTAKTHLSLKHFLLDALFTSNDNARGFAFEHFGAYAIGLAFRSPTRLSDVFNFVVPGALQDEVVELVGLEKSSDGTFSSFPVDISSDTGPSYILGRSTSTGSETLEWFKDPKRSVFCFPAKTIGPDLVLVVRTLSDGRFLRILVQFKNFIQKTLGPTVTQHSFRTTDPTQFVSQKSKKEPSQQAHSAEELPQVEKDKMKPYHIANEKLNKDLGEALHNLGQSTDKAGDFGALRVMCSYPATPDLQIIKNIAKDDTGHHPAATLDIRSIVEGYSEEQILKSMETRLAVAAKQRKRKSGSDEVVPKHSRRKT